MSEPITARTWSAVVENDNVGLEGIYEQAILNLATLQANETIGELEDIGEEIGQEMRPIITDPGETIHLALEGQKPTWWPQILNRLHLKLVIRPEGSTAEHLSPHPIDPNGTDLGKTQFLNIMKNLLEAAGTPFEGNIQLQIFRIRGKVFIGGWRANVYVGEKLKKGKGKNSNGGGERDEMFDLMLEEHRRSTDAMHRMFGNASNVIHASGAAINAMRGANPTPPWMQNGEGEEMPMWLHLAKSAMEMVAAANMGQPGAVAQAGAQVMNHPVQRPGALGAYGGQPPPHQRQLPGPTAQDNLGYNQYMQDNGEYDGYYAAEDDIIDDDFEDDDFEEEEGGYYEEEENDEEWEEEEEEPTPRRGRRGRSGNPLDGLSPSELQAHLDAYIDANPDKKAELKQLGMGLAGKLLG